MQKTRLDPDFFPDYRKQASILSVIENAY